MAPGSVVLHTEASRGFGGQEIRIVAESRWLAGLAARSLGVPVVRSRHVTIPIPKTRALVYRLADRVITSGEAVAAIVRAAGVPAERVVAIGPGLDTARFHPNVSGAAVRRELGLDGPVIGLV